MRGDCGVAGEGRLIGVPKFHSWCKCTMPLTNINSDWMSNTSSGLCIIFNPRCACAARVTVLGLCVCLCVCVCVCVCLLLNISLFM